MEIEEAASTSADPLAMFQTIIARPDVYYKSEQRGEPELTKNDKISILQKLFQSNRLKFLERYHQFINSEHLIFFQNDKSNSEMDLYLSLIAKNSEKRRKTNLAVSKNRRYAALRKMIKEGEYFNDWEMRSRQPLLYEQMIGQYLTEKESFIAFHQGDHACQSLSSIFMDFADSQLTSKRREEEEETEMRYEYSEKVYKRITGKSEEDDSDSELESEDEDNDPFAKKVVPIDNEERQRLKEEFVAIMHERFLNGKDSEFVDYDSIDKNPEYDPMDLIGRDEEDAYFDEESPSGSVENME